MTHTGNNWTLHVGDTRAVLPTLADGSVNCVVTSPPYWGLRDYGHDGQIGLEQTPEAYVTEMVAVFHEVRRVLRDDGKDCGRSRRPPPNLRSCVTRLDAMEV